MCIVDEAVADGVSSGLVADEGMPVVWIELAGDDCRADGVAILQDLAEIPALLAIEGRAAQVVDDQDLEPGDLLEEFGVRPISPGLEESAEEARCTGVEDPVAVTAGLVPQSTGEVGLPDARGSRDDHV